jgi:chromosome segregation ATPase
MKSKANANKITNNHLSNNDNIHTASQQIANNNNNSNNVSLQRNSNNESELYTSVLEKISKCETLLSELKETERMLQTKLQQQSPEECMKQMLTIIAQEARQEQENVARMESELQRIERAIADIETEIDSLQTEKEKLQLFIEMERKRTQTFHMTTPKSTLALSISSLLISFLVVFFAVFLFGFSSRRFSNEFLPS